MISAWLLTTALALPPDRINALVPIGTGRIEGMSTSWDGDVVIGIDAGDKSAWLLHVEDWSLTSVAPCEVRSVAFIGFEDSWGELYVGCASGTVHGYEWDPGESALYELLDEEGAVFTIDMVDPVDGLWYSSVNDRLYSLYAPDSAPNTLHVADPLSGLVDSEGAWPLQLTVHQGFTEGNLLSDEETLIVHHSGNDLTTIQLTTSYASPTIPQGQMLAPVDLHPSWNGGVYGVTNQGVLGEFVGSFWTTVLTGLNDPNAVIASFDETDPWLAVTGGDVRVWQLDSTTGAIVGDVDTPYFLSIPTDQNWIQDGVTSDGWLWGGGTNGNLHVVSAKPWVEPTLLSVTPGAGTDGDEIEIGFTLESEGDWEIRVGGDRDRTGTLLASGTATDAVTLSERLTIGADWEEGDNPIYVFHIDNRNQVGHARTSVFVDNPPPAPTLKKGNLQFGDKKLVLSFDGVPDSDLDHYEVYVTVTPFDGSDYETGGPAFDGTSRLKTPIEVTADPGARVTVDISPLKNDIEHYVAVRAVDQGGLVGPMSNVISETPRPSYSASELAGEKGGPRCATTPGSAGWLAIGLAAIAGIRRRTRFASATIATLGLLGAPSALAQDSGKKKGLEKDLTPQRGDFEMRYGGITLDDRVINRVYDQSQNNILQVEFGPQITRFFEVDFGIGFFQELAFKIDANGNRSGERTMLTWWPALSLDGTARLHIVDEQIVVPYVRGGFDWVVWSEKWDSGVGKTIQRGDKFGTHYGLGGSLLLDVFDKKRASLLEATTGINDTYLTFEWRKQAVDNRKLPWSAPKRSGLDFGATMFTVGLKLDY